MPPVHGQSLAFTRFVENIDCTKRTVINTNFEGRSKIVKVFLTILAMVSILHKILFYKYEIVYFTCSRSFLGSIKDVLLIQIASFRDIKIVNHLHGLDFYTFLHKSPKLYKNILLQTYQKVDTSIVLLQSMKAQFVDFYEMKLEVVSNFYDKELDKKIVDKDDTKINLVYLSNIMSSKGIFELIDAFEILSKKNGNIYLNIAGKFIADEQMTIKEVKKKFNYKIKNNSRIKYMGGVYGKEKIKLLQLSDIFVLASYYKSEAFPISIIEAMSCANAIVATDHNCLPDIVKSENGIIVKKKSAESLANGISKLINNNVNLERIKLHNKIEAREKYSVENYLRSLKKIVLEE